MNCFDPVRALLSEGPHTSVELAAECGVSVRTMNARLQFYRLRGLVRQNGRIAAPTGWRGNRARFWVLA